MKAICKLASLFNSENAEECLTKLQNISVIAGSSMTFATTDWLEKEQIGDVDLFLLQSSSNWHDDFENITKIIGEYFKIENYLIFENQYSPPSDLSVVTIEIDDRINFQVVCTDKLTTDEVVNSFDFGYIQLGLHKDKVVKGRCFRKDKNKNVIIGTTDIRPARFLKALDKGFSTVFFGNAISDHVVASTEVTLDDVMRMNFTPFTREMLNSPIDMTKLKVIEVKMDETHGTNWKGFIIYKGKFVLSDGMTKFEAECVATKIDPRHHRVCIPNSRYHPKIDPDENEHYFITPYFVTGRDFEKIKYKIMKPLKNAKNLICLDIPYLDENSVKDMTKEELEQHREKMFVKHKLRQLSNDSDDLIRIERSAWEAFSYYREEENKTLQEAGTLMVNQFTLDIQKFCDGRHDPFDFLMRNFFDKSTYDNVQSIEYSIRTTKSRYRR